MSTIIQSLEQEQLQRRPQFAAGDRVRVHFQVIEGSRTRTQVFEGVVIKRQGSGVRETFTVRKQSFGVGVERTFPLHSPKVETLEVAARGDVRRAKLYYLRDRVGKAARVAERRWGIGEEALATDPDGAVDAQGVTQVEAPQAVPAADGEETVEEVAQEELAARSRPRRPPPSCRGRDAESEAERGRSGRIHGAGWGAGGRSRRGVRRGRWRRRRGFAAGRIGAFGCRDHHAASQVDDRRDLRTRRHRRLRDRPRAGDPGLRRQAVPDPDRLDDPDPRGRPAGPGAAGQLPLQRSPRSATSSSSTRRRAPTRRRPADFEPLPPKEACPEPVDEEADTNFIKRVVATPGDTLSIEDGHAIVNGEPIPDDFIKPCGSARGCDLPKEITIPPDHYFMMGDNRGASDDSRFWGPVPKDWIIGKAFATYWPLDRIGLL